MREHSLDEVQLFEALCELDATTRVARLSELQQHDPALCERLRKLLAIDSAYGQHTARNVLATQMPDPAADLNDIGAFRLVRQIGRGGMGVVYLGERRSDFEQQVAIKIMPRFAIDDLSRERFAQERRILAQLRHPNICSIIDGGELADQTPYLVMEYVPGENLCAWCTRRASGLRERIELFLQLCDAVQYAHRNLVIHRDLKDNNVLVCRHSDEQEDKRDEVTAKPRGHVKLLDFGIAKSLAAIDVNAHTAAQDQFFSLMSAAPEQVRGDRATVGVDIYALGAMLHQLLCGALPFARPALLPAELRRAILDVVPPRMSEALQREIDAGHTPPEGPDAISPRALRGELDAIVAHCLRKEPAERYTEVGDLSRDLRAWLSGHPIAISSNDRGYRLRKFIHRNRVPVALTALATAGVLSALGITLWQASELRTQRDVAQTARMRSEVDRDRARAVADFMRGTFEQADPNNAAKGGLLARDLIELGKQKLGALDGQPEQQAELALLIAESFAGMGLIEKSNETVLSYMTGIDALARSDPKIRWRSSVLRLSNRIILNKEDLTFDSQLIGINNIANTAEEHVQAARLEERLHARRSEFGLAARSLEKAWQRYAARLSRGSALRLRVDLGSALLNAERLKDAQRIFDAIDRKALQAYEPALQIYALRSIVRELEKRGTHHEALIQAIGDWQRTAEQLYGEASLEAARAYVSAMDVSKDPVEQNRLMQKAYAIQLAKLPPVSAARAYAEANMAYFYREKAHRPDLAEPHSAQAVEIGRNIYGRGHADVWFFELAWAEVLNTLGRYRVCLEQLSEPMGSPEDVSDAEQLSNLHLELAKAAAALQRPANARNEILAVNALWRQLGQPIPASVADNLRAIQMPPRLKTNRP